MDLNTSAGDGVCQTACRSCAACCWARGLTRGELEPRLLRRDRLYRRWFGSGNASRYHHIAYQARVMGPVWFVLAAGMRLPWVGARLRGWYARRVVCPYVHLDNESGRVGCLIHPVRNNGADRRVELAFAGLPGFGCGNASFRCAGAHSAVADPAAFSAWHAALPPTDWYAYSRLAPDFAADSTTSPPGGRRCR